MQNKTQQAIKTSMSKPEDGITPTVSRSRREVSLSAQIAALEVGECASRADKVDPTITAGEFLTQSTPLKMAMRNAVAASMRSARAQTGGEYSIEVSTLVTTPGQIYFVAIITRTE